MSVSYVGLGNGDGEFLTYSKDGTGDKKQLHIGMRRFLPRLQGAEEAPGTWCFIFEGVVFAYLPKLDLECTMTAGAQGGQARERLAHNEHNLRAPSATDGYRRPDEAHVLGQDGLSISIRESASGAQRNRRQDFVHYASSDLV